MFFKRLSLIFFSTVLAFGLFAFSVNQAQAALTITKVEGCDVGDLGGFDNCVTGKVKPGQILIVSGTGFKDGNKLSVTLAGYDGEIKIASGYSAEKFIATIPSNASVGNSNIRVAVLSPQSDGTFKLLSSKTVALQVVGSSSTSPDKNPPVNGQLPSGDPCEALKTQYGNDSTKWPVITSKKTNNDSNAVRCAKSLIMKKAPAFKLDVSSPVYDQDLVSAVTDIQVGYNRNNPSSIIDVDGGVGSQTWPVLVAGSFDGNSATGGGDDKKDPQNPTDPKKPTDPGSGDGSTDCSFLGSDYIPKNGLCFPKQSVTGSADSLVGSQSLGDVIRNVMRILLTLAGALAVLFIVIGGVMYMTSAGNTKRAEQGMQILKAAVFGLVISALGYTIVTIVYNLLISGSVF